jgi:hypothetical protein
MENPATLTDYHAGVGESTDKWTWISTTLSDAIDRSA